METRIDFEDASEQTLGDNGSTSAAVAMIVCGVAMFMMLVACSQPANAQVLTLDQGALQVRAPTFAVPLGRVTVTPAPEDRPAPARDKWQRFEQAPNASRVSHRYRVSEIITNDGARTACYTPCVINCCVGSGGFSLAYGR